SRKFNVMKKAVKHNGFIFKRYEEPFQTPFDKLFELFKELITHTSGDFEEAIDWLRQLDKEFKLTTPAYTVDDSIEDLKNKVYIVERLDFIGRGGVEITSKLQKTLGQNSMNQVLGKMSKDKSTNNKANNAGRSQENTEDLRNYKYGDSLEKI